MVRFHVYGRVIFVFKERGKAPNGSNTNRERRSGRADSAKNTFEKLLCVCLARYFLSFWSYHFNTYSCKGSNLCNRDYLDKREIIML